AEAAFYDGLSWQRKVSYQRFIPMSYPLVSRHLIWSFSIDPPPAIIDLEHAEALAAFQYPPYFLLNPSLNPRQGIQQIDQPGSVDARDYTGTQGLADDIRGHIPRASSHSRPEGVKSPTFRLKRKHNFRPHLFAMFILDPAAQVPFAERSRL